MHNTNASFRKTKMENKVMDIDDGKYLQLAKNIDISVDTYKTLKDSLYPGASHQSICSVVSYCKSVKVDPLLKPVHIVPMSVKEDGEYKMRDVIMPGIGLFRIIAARSGEYLGIEEPIFGDDITEQLGGLTITYPKYCKVTVKKLVNGHVVGFTAVELWKENYATKGRGDSRPNMMWEKRPYGQIAKCAEAQALRKAFPDRLGQVYTHEEMEGKTYDANYSKIQETATASYLNPSIEENKNKKFDDKGLSIYIDKIDECKTIDDLKVIYTEAYAKFKNDQFLLNALIGKKESKKMQIEEDNIPSNGETNHAVI